MRLQKNGVKIIPDFRLNVVNYFYSYYNHNICICLISSGRPGFSFIQTFGYYWMLLFFTRLTLYYWCKAMHINYLCSRTCVVTIFIHIYLYKNYRLVKYVNVSNNTNRYLPKCIFLAFYHKGEQKYLSMSFVKHFSNNWNRS